MKRVVCCLGLALVACGPQMCRAAAPPASTAAPRLRSLSLTEAIHRALQQQGHRTEAKGAGPVLLHLSPDTPRLEAERVVYQRLLNVENAYWNLYGSCWTLHSREQGLRQAHEALQQARARHEAGRTSVAEVHQARGQYALFRAQRLQALDHVLENEQQLRALVGMEAERDVRLVPSDSPVLTPCRPDWKAALREALTGRPELRCASREALFCRVMAVTEAAARALLEVPADEAQVRLARAMEVLKDQELKAQRYLGLYYRRLSTEYEQIRANRSQREAFGEQLRARYQEYQADRINLDILLEAQRFWADALANEYQSVVRYNNALAGWDYARGATLRRHNLSLAETDPARAEAPRAVGEMPSLPAVMAAGCR